MSLSNLVKKDLDYEFEGKVYRIKKITPKLLFEIKEYMAKKLTRLNKIKFDDNIEKIQKLKNIGVPIDALATEFMQQKLTIDPDEISLDDLFAKANDLNFLTEILKIVFVNDVDEEIIFKMFREDGETLMNTFIKAFGIKKEKVEKEAKKIEEHIQKEGVEKK